MVDDPAKLSRRAIRQIEQAGNELWFSPLSIWELVLLREKRRISLNQSVARWFQETIGRASLHEAAMTADVALESEAAVLPYADPVDRLLVATARVHDLTLLTADE